MRRSGFTLVELIVVILIIAALAAFILPAINGAINRAREVQVVTDISMLGKAMTSFEARLGVPPPSFMVLPEDPALWVSDWDSSPPAPGIGEMHRRWARAYLRQAWPEFDFTYGGTTLDLNDDGDDDDFLVLNGSECLVFMLGGVINREDSDGDGVDEWSTVGFSTNPSAPFSSTGGSRVGPFYEFDPGRLVDIDAQFGFDADEQMPEYLDPLPGQKMPYQFFSGYDGLGSRAYGLDYDVGGASNPSTTDDETLPGGHGLAEAYYTQTLDSAPVYFHAYQIISPGQDGEFGTGGFYNGNDVGPARAEERDNIGSFSNGRLN